MEIKELLELEEGSYQLTDEDKNYSVKVSRMERECTVHITDENFNSNSFMIIYKYKTKTFEVLYKVGRMWINLDVDDLSCITGLESTLLVK